MRSRRLKIFFNKKNYCPNLKDFLFFLLFLTLPFQLGKHFWLKESFLFGLKVDYLSPAFYFQDLLILILIFLEIGQSFVLKGNIKKISISFKVFKKYINDKFAVITKNKLKLWFYFLTIVFIVLNIVFSKAPRISLYWWIRIFEFFLLGVVIKRNLKKAFKILFICLPLILFFEFFLGFFQALKSSSLGGFFWFFGERSFNILTPGIARGSFLGKVFLRPYATFSHPNSLAGFTLVCLVLLLGKEEKNYFDKIALILGIALIVLSFSRAAWLSLTLVFFFFFVFRLFSFVKKKENPFSYSYFLALIASFPLFYLFTRTTIDSSSFEIRIKLAESALRLIKANPLFGVGAGNFVIGLSESNQIWQWLYWLQPVHNIFLLLFSELGLIFGVLFPYFYFRTFFNLFKDLSKFQRQKLTLAAGLLSVALTGLFDHYWLTLIQNQLLLTTLLSFSIFNKENLSFK